MPVKFININESDFLDVKPCLLFKYMPLESALSLVIDKYLWFANPVIWNDPFEKKFIEGKYEINGKKVDFPLKEKVFCSCMTETATSEAYWNAYQNGQLGISFKFKRKKLLEILYGLTDYDVYIGKVKYVVTNCLNKNISDIAELKSTKQIDIHNVDLQIKLLLLKRVSFCYENEIRILIVQKNKTNCKGLKIPVSPVGITELIDTVTIDPRAEKHTEKMLKEYFKSFGLKKVYKSQLYTIKNKTGITI